MSFYLDASVLIPSRIEEQGTPAVHAFLAANGNDLLVSELAVAEFVSAASRMVRTGALTETDALTALANLDQWRAETASVVELHAADVRVAYGFLRLFRLKLRAPDALHLAAVRRVDATLVTFDRRLAEAARALGQAVVEPR